MIVVLGSEWKRNDSQLKKRERLYGEHSVSIEFIQTFNNPDEDLYINRMNCVALGAFYANARTLQSSTQHFLWLNETFHVDGLKCKPRTSLIRTWKQSNTKNRSKAGITHVALLVTRLLDSSSLRPSDRDAAFAYRVIAAG